MSTQKSDARTRRRTALREQLYERAKHGDLGLVEAIRMMRKIADKTQAEYAKMVHVSPRVLIDFERGVGNPTLRSLERMLSPFGFELTVRRRLGPALEEAPFRFNVLDESQAMVDQAREMREAVEVARARARASGSTHFIRDSRRASRVVVSVGPDGKLGKAT